MVKSNIAHLPSYFVAQPLARNRRNFLAYTLICMEIIRKAGIILLNDHSRGFFNGLRSHTTLKQKTMILDDMDWYIKEQIMPKRD